MLRITNKFFRKAHASRSFNAKERSGKVGKYTHHTSEFSSSRTEQPYAKQEKIKLTTADLQEVRQFKEKKFNSDKRVLLPPGSSKAYSISPSKTITVPAVGGPKKTYQPKNYSVNPLVRLKQEVNRGISYDSSVVKQDYGKG